MKLSITLQQSPKCYACGSPESTPFYVGTCCYHLCHSCIEAIRGANNKVLEGAYLELDMEEYRKLIEPLL